MSRLASFLLQLSFLRVALGIPASSPHGRVKPMATNKSSLNAPQPGLGIPAQHTNPNRTHGPAPDGTTVPPSSRSSTTSRSTLSTRLVLFGLLAAVLQVEAHHLLVAVVPTAAEGTATATVAVLVRMELPTPTSLLLPTVNMLSFRVAKSSLLMPTLLRHCSLISSLLTVT